MSRFRRFDEAGQLFGQEPYVSEDEKRELELEAEVRASAANGEELLHPRAIRASVGVIALVVIVLLGAIFYRRL